MPVNIDEKMVSILRKLPLWVSNDGTVCRLCQVLGEEGIQNKVMGTGGMGKRG